MSRECKYNPCSQIQCLLIGEQKSQLEGWRLTLPIKDCKVLNENAH